MAKNSFNGLYRPKAADFIDDGEHDVSGFLRECCVRLRRIAPDVRSIDNLCKQMEEFGESCDSVMSDDECDECRELKTKIDDLESDVSTKDEEIKELEGDLEEADAPSSVFDLSLPD